MGSTSPFFANRTIRSTSPHGPAVPTPPPHPTAGRQVANRWDAALRPSSHSTRQGTPSSLSNPERKSEWILSSDAPVNALAFSPGGEWLIAGADDGTVWGWSRKGQG